MKAGDICIRALNQYRHYDVLAYLGLRYYLNNSAARSDLWAQKLATDVVLTRAEAPYLLSQQFKEFDDEGKIKHRDIYIPGPNEALAEIALLSACAKYEAFSNPEYVFSYSLNKRDRKGAYLGYMEGLTSRHRAIAEACNLCQNGVVAYTDIKSFYPSIMTDLAVTVWNKNCDTSGISEIYRSLGDRLIHDHGRANGSISPHILIGPMFSHFVANLILRELDEEFVKLPVKYFRYVDDITLVGEREKITASTKIIRERLKQRFNLELHDDDSPKSITIPSHEWLKGKEDFNQNNVSHSWMTFAADLKRFLLFNPESYEIIREKFIENGFRIPFRNYNAAIQERDYTDRIIYLFKKQWFRRKLSSISIGDLMLRATSIRNECDAKFRELLRNANTLTGFNRKRCIPKLRYCAGRLIYLATDDTLASLSILAREIPELHLHAEVMMAVSSGNIDGILPLGVNVAQVAAQPLKAAEKQCRLTKEFLTPSEQHALSVFFLNGINVSQVSTPGECSDILRFATNGADISLMRQTDNPVLREIACLHGVGGPRHSACLETAFDIDEELAMDAIEQPWQSCPAW
ncbi:hypothetical protein ANRL3_02553 [Anaerolineae bacterium]|nr:hypothetical protein ANRL3_02553 [Anaerolineae bacterium]